MVFVRKNIEMERPREREKYHIHGNNWLLSMTGDAPEFID
jgi:hypothetical protein